MPFYVGDFLAATATWEGEERSLYMMLLAYQWAAGPLPTEPRRIAKMCQYDVPAFMKLWLTVGKKFVETDEGLINERVEEHRLKSLAISDARANAAAKGVAKRRANHGQEPSKPTAIAHGLLNHPIQSNPDHPNPDQGDQSQSAPDGAVTGAPRGTFDGWKFVEERVRPSYPPGTYRDNTWLIASRDIERLVAEGESPELISQSAGEYHAQQDALCKTGTQFVLSPAKFFGSEGHWRGPFPLPASKAPKAAAWLPPSEPAQEAASA